jgi:UDPglucose 6-dehydrogenase
MKVTVFGAGYVGLVSAACFAEMGNDVVCVDQDPVKIEALRRGQMPIVEPGLDAYVNRNAAAGRLHFTLDVPSAVLHGEIILIAVGTPAGQDGRADLTDVLATARAIGQSMQDYRLVVLKSTAPVGTCEQISTTIQEALKARSLLLPFSVAANPEFLKQGAAIDDFMRPSRVVIGSNDVRAEQTLRLLYAPFIRNRERVLVMDVRSAELSKYAANAMLATRISFMNELAGLAELLGADIEHVRNSMGSDPRIGTHFLYAGCGYGGSCLPKDVQALLQTAQSAGSELQLLNAVDATNRKQQTILADRVVNRFGNDLHGLQFALWGLAFKPGTDDVRAAPSLATIRALHERGASITAWDPLAQRNAAKALGALTRLTYVGDPMLALEGADALLVMTEWRALRSPDLQEMRNRLRQPVIFDGRNVYEPGLMASLRFEYYGIGRGASMRRPDDAMHERAA